MQFTPKIGVYRAIKATVNHLLFLMIWIKNYHKFTKFHVRSHLDPLHLIFYYMSSLYLCNVSWVFHLLFQFMFWLKLTMLAGFCLIWYLSYVIIISWLHCLFPRKMADAFDDAPVAIAELPQIKLFGRWPSEDVNHSDMSLAVSCCFSFH
jgi:hypothetical protein